MMPNTLLIGAGVALAVGLFAAGADAAPSQFVPVEKAPQSNDLCILTRGGHGGHGGGHWGGHGGGHWGGHRGGGRYFRRGFRGRGFGYGYYGYDNGCWWSYGRLVCPGWYGGYPY